MTSSQGNQLLPDSMRTQTVVDRLYDAYAEHVSSSPEEPDKFLRDNGYDPDQLVEESIVKVKEIQQRILTEKSNKQ